jgi:hypothetical protein
MVGWENYTNGYDPIWCHAFYFPWSRTDRDWIGFVRAPIHIITVRTDFFRNQYPFHVIDILYQYGIQICDGFHNNGFYFV